MKNLLIIALALAAFPAASHAAGYDGCYQLVVPGAMYPKFCLQGTTEEGLNGANVRLAIFRTNTEILLHCARSSASAGNETGFTFEVNGVKEMILSNVTSSNGVRTGDATFGSTKLNFVQFGAETALRLMKIANSDPRCQ
jgi:hypothetical protein